MKFYIEKANSKKQIFSIFILICALQALFASSPKKKSFSEECLVNMGPSQKGVPFDVYTIGENAQSFTAKRYIEPFKINAYETTYNLWYVVRVYAEQKGYVFANPGQAGSMGKRGAAPDAQNSMEPVTMISWYDCVVWCNAYSEMMGKKPCYYSNGKIIRDATDTASLDKAECKWNADGYRLPTESEWEYAARKTESGFQSGALASGQIDDMENSIGEEEVAWFDANSTSTHTVGTAGTVFTPDAPPAPGTGNANECGLFDMSGNVLEYCWDWFSDYKEGKEGKRYTGEPFGEKRTARGGSWSPYTLFIEAGDRYEFDPNEAYNYLGFRFCTSK